MSMTTYRKGDVVPVPFDFTDGSGTKWRPAVVISDERYNADTPDVLIASVTGNTRALPHPGDHTLTEWRPAGLLMPSIAQTKIATIENRLVRRKLGALASSDLAALESGLRQAMGLA